MHYFASVGDRCNYFASKARFCASQDQINAWEYVSDVASVFKGHREGSQAVKEGASRQTRHVPRDNDEEQREPERRLDERTLNFCMYLVKQNV